MNTEARVYSQQNPPSLQVAAQIARNLGDAWKIVTSDFPHRVIGSAYAHPSRLDPTNLQRRMMGENTWTVTLETPDETEASAMLFKLAKSGIYEAGSIVSRNREGVRLIGELYRQAESLGIPVFEFDTATCRTGMERVADEAARQSDYILTPTYVSPYVWGDPELATWGAIGYQAISKKYLQKNGPIQIPYEIDLGDGMGQIIDAVKEFGNNEGKNRNVPLVFETVSQSSESNGTVEKIVDNLYRVALDDIEGRKMLIAKRYRPCGLEFGVINGEIVVYAQYSPFNISEPAVGKHIALTSEHHPTRTTREDVAELTRTIRRCRGDVN